MRNKLFLFFYFGLLSAVVFFTPGHIAAGRADNGPNERFQIHLDKKTIAKGYTVSGFEEDIKLSLAPGILSDETKVEIIKLNEDLPMPWALDLASDIYQFEFKNKEAYEDEKPFYIQFSYNDINNDYKQVYFYDKNFSKWRPLPTKDHVGDLFVRSLIHLPYARIAVFSNPGKMISGRASWYAYKNGDYTASPDFPKGSMLRIRNIENGKFVDVEVNDYGPDRRRHPERVVDLDKQAFSKLAPLSQGMIEVAVEPLHIEEDPDGSILGISPAGAGAYPEPDLKAAIIMDENSGRVIWKKNATSVLPVASLTKLVSIKTFFDTRPSLNDPVEYLYQDEEYNYQYAKKWELARLGLEEGDVATIEDMVYASLVGSANNTVETLVRASGLNRSDFIEKMNENARQWGASSSKFYDPTGLDPENVSSPLDYAIITKEALKHPIIAKASVTDEYEFSTLNTNKDFRIRNTNKIINTDRFNITGSKTGYLDEALYCLMTRIEESGKSIIVVSLGAKTRDLSFQETIQLIKYGLRQLK